MATFQLSPQSEALLARLEPKPLFRHFLALSETPRPSDDCTLVREKLVNWAKSKGFTALTDAAGNVVIRKPASKGYETAVPVIIQSHMDMVCSKAADKEHDFYKDPLTLRIEGDWLKADGTTLGADDGIGVAASLAILEDPTLVHGPLECLITAEEETTMNGAMNLDPNILQGQVLINVDSEEPGRVCMGCAGGFEKQLFLPLKRQAPTEQDGVIATVSIYGLLGGHTGGDITKGRANALLLLARLLSDALETVPFRIISMKGGNAPNAIPRDATAELFVAKDKADTLCSVLQSLHAAAQREFQEVEKVPVGAAPVAHNASTDICPCSLTKRSEEDGKCERHGQQQQQQFVSSIQMALSLKAYSAGAALPPCTAESTRKALDLMLNIPHGVLRYQPGAPTDPETSTSFSLVALPTSIAPVAIVSDDSKAISAAENAESTVLLLHTFTRSTSDEQMDAYERRLEALARLAGASFSKRLNYFPGWYPKLDTQVLQLTVRAHEELFSAKPDVYSVHAGLECGWLQKLYPRLESVSIGPLVEDAHSPDEKLYIPSVAPFYAWLRRIVELLANPAAPAPAPIKCKPTTAAEGDEDAPC